MAKASSCVPCNGGGGMLAFSATHYTPFPQPALVQNVFWNKYNSAFPPYSAPPPPPQPPPPLLITPIYETQRVLATILQQQEVKKEDIDPIAKWLGPPPKPGEFSWEFERRKDLLLGLRDYVNATNEDERMDARQLVCQDPWNRFRSSRETEELLLALGYAKELPSLEERRFAASDAAFRMCRRDWDEPHVWWLEDLWVGVN